MAEPLIAALATASGPAALAVVRLSGNGAAAAAARFLRGWPLAPKPRTLYRALVVDARGEPIDDVLVAHFPAPHSYTGEEVIEVQCHGGPAVARAVEACALAAGARLATPGEFTARAVRNGRMDLLDAEALAALLTADDAAGLRAARSLAGSAVALRRLALAVRGAWAEAVGSADYPLETAGEKLAWREAICALLSELAALARAGPAELELREGSRVALLGPPNAGKSTLFNALLGEARALVDAVPGTTRDSQGAAALWRGRRVTLYDTAGLREADGLEGRGVARSRQVAAEADVVVWVEDGSAQAAEPPEGLVPAVRVWSKADLPRHPVRGESLPSGTLSVSAERGEGLEALRERLASLTAARPVGLTGRQREAVERAVTWLKTAQAASDDVAGAALAEAAEALASLTTGAAAEAGEAIFARFCVGK